jgi:hypothetical protein
MPHVSSSAVIDDMLRTLPLPSGLAGTGTSPLLLLAPVSAAAAAAAAAEFAAEDNAEVADNALARDAALLLASLLLQQVLGHTSAAAVAVETAGASMSGSC